MESRYVAKYNPIKGNNDISRYTYHSVTRYNDYRIIDRNSYNDDNDDGEQ